MTSGTTWGNRPARGASKGPEAGDVRQDFNEQRLIYKCILDPSVDNSGYAGVTRVVRTGGSARMDGSTLVIENASSVMLLTRIEYFPDLQRGQSGSPTAGGGTNHPGLCGPPGTPSQGPIGNAQPRHGGFRRRLPIRHVRRGASVRSAVAAGLFTRLAGEDFRNGPPLVHPHQRQASEHPGRGQLHHQPANARFGAGRHPPWRRNPTGGNRPHANRRRGAGRPPRRHGGLLQLDREPGPRLPDQRQKHLRVPWHVVSPLAATRNGRQVLLLQQLRDWEPLALLDFRRRAGLPPVLGPLSGHRRPGFPPQPHCAGPERSWRCFTRIS